MPATARGWIMIVVLCGIGGGCKSPGSTSQTQDTSFLGGCAFYRTLVPDWNRVRAHYGEISGSLSQRIVDATPESGCEAHEYEEFLRDDRVAEFQCSDPMWQMGELSLTDLRMRTVQGTDYYFASVQEKDRMSSNDTTGVCVYLEKAAERDAESRDLVSAMKNSSVTFYTLSVHRRTSAPVIDGCFKLSFINDIKPKPFSSRRAERPRDNSCKLRAGEI